MVLSLLVMIEHRLVIFAPNTRCFVSTEGSSCWGRALVLGTFREEILVFIKINEKFEITEEVRLDMNEHIRVLQVLSSGALLATTDSGKLITVTSR